MPQSWVSSGPGGVVPANMDLDDTVPMGGRRVWRAAEPGPSLPACSTPVPWTSVGRGRPRPPSPQAPVVTTSNRFSILETPAQPSEPGPEHPPVRAPHTAARSQLLRLAVKRRSGPSGKFTSIPTTSQVADISSEKIKTFHVQSTSSSLQMDVPSTAPLPPRSNPGTSSSSSVNSAPPSIPSLLSSTPTTYLIGDSIIRNVRFRNAITCCLPGAKVPAILKHLQHSIASLPSTITRLIIHVGYNDTSSRHFEDVKRQFMDLFECLKATGISAFISGPAAVIPRGTGDRYNRVLYLHNWLHRECRGQRLGYINNFDSTWNCHELFNWDGVHLNGLGARTLTDHFRYTVNHVQLTFPDH